jgi:uncharacterized protein YkwD
MDFDAFHRGVYQFLVSAAATVASILPTNQAAVSHQPLEKPGFNLSVNEDVVNKLTFSSYDIETSLVATSKAEEETLVPVINLKDGQIPPDEPSGEITVNGENQLPAASKTSVLASDTPKSKKNTPEIKTENSTEATKSAKKTTAVKPKPSPTEEPASIAETPSNSTTDPFDLPVRILNSALNPELLFDMANQHRAKIGLSLFEKEERMCKLAKYRAPMLQHEIFGNGVMHAGLKALNLPYWVTENIAGYRTEQQIFDFWITDYIHKIAVEGDYKYSCVACHGNTCTQVFSSLVPK